MTEPVALNRSDKLRAIAWLRGIQECAKGEEDKLRGELTAEAVAEYEAQGTPPRWPLRDVAVAILPVSEEAVRVSDEWAFLQWCKKRYPDAVETVEQISPGWRKNFLEQQAHVDLGAVFDGETGEVVPGLSVRPGGVPLGVSVRVTHAAKQVFAALASHGLRKLALEAGPAVPTVLAEVNE